MLLNITIAGQGLQLQACWSALLALSRKVNYCINPDVMKALGMCGLISRTNLFISFVRRPKVLNNLYSPTPNRLFSFYLVGAFRPTGEFFTHMETSLLPVKGCNFWPVFETHGHSSLRVLERVTSSVTRGIHLQWLSLRTNDTHTNWWAFSSWAVTACFYHLDLSRLGFEHSNYRLLGEHSNSLHHCGDPE